MKRLQHTLQTQHIRRIVRMSVLIALAMIFPAAPVLADQNITNYETFCTQQFECGTYDPNFCGAGGTAATASETGTDKATSGSWTSNVQPPYILEEFAIETLKDIAAKKGVDPSQAVTQEHVIALVAFMLGEGGDINNSDLFNPLNTGINDPTLINGPASSSGLQSFKSFDAGVEATARTMVGSNQSRLGAVLTQPNSTATDFMNALTYYKNYPGNLEWAEASLPPNTDKYYQQRLNLVQQVRNKYADIAGTVLGTPAFELIDNITAKNKLQYHPAGDQSTGTDNVGNTSLSTCGGSTGGVVVGDIVKTAEALAWPNIIGPDGQNHIVYPGQADGGKSKATALYQTTMPAVNGSTGSEEFSDCGVFTSTVMIASGADKDFPKRSTTVQKAYVIAHPEKYHITYNPKSTAELHKGDVLIGDSHTYIYTGPYTGDDGKSYNAAAASLAETTPGHAPQADNWYQESDFIAATLISQPNTTSTGTAQ